MADLSKPTKQISLKMPSKDVNSTEQSVMSESQPKLETEKEVTWFTVKKDKNVSIFGNMTTVRAGTKVGKYEAWYAALKVQGVEFEPFVED